jgi:glutaredoxin
MASGQGPTVRSVHITVVESEACHFCADAQSVLSDMATRYPLAVETIDVHCDTGRELMARHRASMSPLVLLDGAYFSNGRLPRRKLTKTLEQRFAAGPSTLSTAGGESHG